MSNTFFKKKGLLSFYWDWHSMVTSGALHLSRAGLSGVIELPGHRQDLLGSFAQQQVGQVDPQSLSPVLGFARDLSGCDAHSLDSLVHLLWALSHTSSVESLIWEVTHERKKKHFTLSARFIQSPHWLIWRALGCYLVCSGDASLHRFLQAVWSIQAVHCTRQVELQEQPKTNL